MPSTGVAFTVEPDTDTRPAASVVAVVVDAASVVADAASVVADAADKLILF